MTVNTKNVLAVFLLIIALSATILAMISYHNSSSLHYTDEELQALYEKYDITENDLKYARGELPPVNVLGNDTRAIATEDGLPPEDLEEGIDYDVVYRQDEWRIMIDKAHAEYMEEYGVDPANPKLDYVGGYYLPLQEIDRLAHEGNFAFM